MRVTDARWPTALPRLLRVVAVGLGLLLTWIVIGVLWTRYVDDIGGPMGTVFAAAATIVYLPIYALADMRRLPATASRRTQTMAVLYGWLFGLPASYGIILALVGLTWVVRL